jgi:hypothetical protein
MDRNATVPPFHVGQSVLLYTQQHISASDQYYKMLYHVVASPFSESFLINLNHGKLLYFTSFLQQSGFFYFSDFSLERQAGVFCNYLLTIRKITILELLIA